MENKENSKKLQEMADKAMKSMQEEIEMRKKQAQDFTTKIGGEQ